LAFKWIFPYIKRYKGRMLGGLLLVLICSALNMVSPYLSGIIVDKVIVNQHVSILPILIISIVSATFLKAILRYTFLMNFERVSQNLIFDLKSEIYNKLQEQDFDFFDKTNTGDIMTKMTGDIDMVRHFVAFVIYNVFDNATNFIFAVTLMFTINYKFTLILLAITPLTFIFALKLSTNVRASFFAIRAQFSKLNSVVQENISGNRLVKAFAKEDFEKEKFNKINHGFKEKNLASAAIWEKYLPVLDSLAGSMVVLMILIGGILVINKSLTIGQLVTFNSLIFALNNPMRMIGWLINDIQRFSTSGEKIMDLLRIKPTIKNHKAKVKKEKLNGNIEFINVSFSYGDEEVLKDINLKVSPGETIAIIGPTGSGKSTLVSLICRFYDSTEGEILIDDINIKDIDVNILRERISTAMQDIFLFSDTIEGNIAYGVPDASMERIQWVASMADAHEFIQNMPEGYDTIIGERGVGLSGGQRQRIALARALLKNPDILILDDTTSSVDMETEHKIHKTLNSYFKDKTTFIIAHRISSVKNADKILVLNNGSIVEQGTHAELLHLRGQYFSVYINQLGDFDNIDAKVVG